MRVPDYFARHSTMLMGTPSDERGPSHVRYPNFDHRLNYFYDVFFGTSRE